MRVSASARHLSTAAEHVAQVVVAVVAVDELLEVRGLTELVRGAVGGQPVEVRGERRRERAELGGGASGEHGGEVARARLAPVVSGLLLPFRVGLVLP